MIPEPETAGNPLPVTTPVGDIENTAEPELLLIWNGFTVPCDAPFLIVNCVLTALVLPPESVPTSSSVVPVPEVLSIKHTVAPTHAKKLFGPTVNVPEKILLFVNVFTTSAPTVVNDEMYG